MAYSLLYFDEVEADIHEAKTWYKKQQEGLDVKFADAVENVVMQILEFPNSYAIHYKSIRIVHPKKFPYNIHFYIDESNKTVIITAVVHSKRHPNTAKKRF